MPVLGLADVSGAALERCGGQQSTQVGLGGCGYSRGVRLIVVMPSVTRTMYADGEAPWATVQARTAVPTGVRLTAD